MQNKADYYFKQAMQEVLDNGQWDENPRPYWLEEDGSKTPAHSKFITHVLNTYDLDKGEYPFLTLRPMPWKTGIKELLWIFQDQSNDLNLLKSKYNVHYWDDWNVGDDTIGQRYGHTVRRYDLMNKLLKGIKENPYGRRHIMSMWQEEEFKDDTKGLPPCAFETIWTVRGEFLDMSLIQRSSDHATAGSAINETSYCALLLMVARHCGYKPGKFSHFIINLHMYDRHEKQVRAMLEREPVKCNPRLILNPNKTDFYDITIDDFVLEDYPLDEIKAKNPQLKFPLAI